MFSLSAFDTILVIMLFGISCYAFYAHSMLSRCEQWESRYYRMRDLKEQWKAYAQSLTHATSTAKIESDLVRANVESIRKGEKRLAFEPATITPSKEDDLPATMTPLFGSVVPDNYVPVLNEEGIFIYAPKPDEAAESDAKVEENTESDAKVEEAIKGLLAEIDKLSKDIKSDSTNGNSKGKSNGKSKNTDLDKTGKSKSDSSTVEPVSNGRKSDKLNKEARKQIGKAFGKRTEEVFSWLDSRDYDITTVDTATLIDRAKKSGKFN